MILAPSLIRPSRREMLRLLGLSGISSAFSPRGRARTRRRFSRKSPRARAASRGFTRTRCRPNRYLPETMGPGVAFLDYDNDGWMDIFMVNSGAGDFYQAEGAAEERALQEQSRRHVHRRHRQGRCRRRTTSSAWGAPSPTTTTTDTRTSSSRPTGAARCITTTATARSPT